MDVEYMLASNQLSELAGITDLDCHARTPIFPFTEHPYTCNLVYKQFYMVLLCSEKKSPRAKEVTKKKKGGNYRVAKSHRAGPRKLLGFWLGFHWITLSARFISIILAAEVVVGLEPVTVTTEARVGQRGHRKPTSTCFELMSALDSQNCHLVVIIGFLHHLPSTVHVVSSYMAKNFPRCIVTVTI